MYRSEGCQGGQVTEICTGKKDEVRDFTSCMGAWGIMYLGVLKVGEVKKMAVLTVVEEEAGNVS